MLTEKGNRLFFIVLMLCLSLCVSPAASASPEKPVRKAENASDRSPLQATDLGRIETLDLRTAAKIALSRNPSLAAAEARVRQAQERLIQARSAYWPSLDATLSGARVSLSESDYQSALKTARLFSPNAAVDEPQSRYQTALTATWLLFDGFQRKFARASAQYGQSQSEAARSETKRLLLSSVASAYFSAQLALENIAIARADEAFNQRQLIDAQARHRIGTGSLSDVLNFKIRVNEARTRLISAERIYQEAMFGLAALLGMPGSRFPDGMALARLKQETAAEMTRPDPDALADYALLHRPDLAANDYALKQAESQVKIARGRYYPAINLAASVAGDRTDDAGFTGDDFGNSVGFNLTYNLFAGGSDRARVREAKYREVEQQKNLEDLKLRVSSQVRASSNLLLSTQRQLVLQRANTDLNQQNRDLVEKEYAAGQVSLVRLNEAQRDLTTAQSRLALSLAALRQAWFNLETDTGRILAILPETE